MHEDGVPQYPPDVSDSEDTYPIKHYSEIQALEAKIQYDFTKAPDDVMMTIDPSSGLALLNSTSESSKIAYDLTSNEPALMRACRIIERAWVAYTILHYGYSYSDDSD